LSETNWTLAYRRADSLPDTIAERTRWIYDKVAKIYPLSTMFFHARAHRALLEDAGIRDGMQVLEVATGSGEMFRRLVKTNPGGATFGLDLSPNMAARTQRLARKRFPAAQSHCQAVDVRNLPFRDRSFDALVCCYLLELLDADDILVTLREFTRVLRDDGTVAMVLIGQNGPIFNQLYKVCGGLAPAFWGRQVERDIPALLRAAGLEIVRDRGVRQTGYPSRVLVIRKRRTFDGEHSNGHGPRLVATRRN
jgi:ubiquinone/menaquinone biosynthesis C-methylase UbiE